MTSLLQMKRLIATSSVSVNVNDHDPCLSYILVYIVIDCDAEHGKHKDGRPGGFYLHMVRQNEKENYGMKLTELRSRRVVRVQTHR